MSFNHLAYCLSFVVSLMINSTLVASESGDLVPEPQTRVVDVAKLDTIDTLVDALVTKRVVLIGERHNRYEDHLNQLAIIKGLHARGKDLAIGMEFFQQPYQTHLDAYVAGEISEAEMLKRTEYFERWRFDYRLYRPLLRFAHEHKLPLIALNVPREITRKVGADGIESLSEDERAGLPSGLDTADDAYRERIKSVFEQHPKGEDADFEHFFTAQLLWDEGMAERAAAYLEANPDKTLVVLAGNGHLEYGQGIPQRIQRRIATPQAIVLNGALHGVDPKIADYLLYSEPLDLPPAGMLGVMLDNTNDGIEVKGFAEPSGAQAAGMEEGDRIVRIAERTIADYADIRLALIDTQPGQTLEVGVERPRLLGDARLNFEIELH